MVYENGTGSLPKYKITTYGWSDADYPLKYKFYYKYVNESSATTLAIVVGLPTSIEAILPSNILGDSLEIRVGVKVCDKYEMCSTKEIILNIESQNNTIDANLTKILEQNCEPIKSLAIMRSLMQTFSSDNQLQEQFMPNVEHIFSQIFVAINERLVYKTSFSILIIFNHVHFVNYN